MGYYTDFDFSANTPEIIREVNKIHDTPETNLYFHDAKWYSWKKDMRQISLKYPKTLITLEGQGEEADDAWIAYFLGGKSQIERAVKTYAPFDIEKLK